MIEEIAYKDLKEGDFFLINDIKALPKQKTATGYVDLITGYENRDIDIPEKAKTDFHYMKIDKTELEYWKSQLNLSFKVNI